VKNGTNFFGVESFKACNFLNLGQIFKNFGHLVVQTMLHSRQLKFSKNFYSLKVTDHPDICEKNFGLMCRFLCALPKMCILIINYINDKNISRKKKDL
jgi:hypothetical protein